MSYRDKKPGGFNLLRLKAQPTGAIITFVRSDFDESDVAKLVRNVRYLTESNEYSLFSGTYGQRKVNFLSTGSGPASLLSALYELTPSKIGPIVRIGASGGLRGAHTQDVVIVRSAFCMDRVSYALAKTKRVIADSTLMNQLSESLRAGRTKCRVEKVVSVDAMYLFERNVRRAEAQGAYCWDLETATILAFGRMFKVRTASVLYVVSDRAGNAIRSYPPIRKLGLVSSVLKALSV